MLACAVWSIACAVLRSPSRKSKSSQIFENAYIPASVGEECGQGCMWCGVEMGWKGLLPKAYPQNVWMCKSPVCGRGGIERRCAHRPRELSLQARGRPRSTPVCAVLIFLSHFRLSGEGFISSSIYTNIEISCHFSGTSCSPRHG